MERLPPVAVAAADPEWRPRECQSPEKREDSKPLHSLQDDISLDHLDNHSPEYSDLLLECHSKLGTFNGCQLKFEHKARDQKFYASQGTQHPNTVDPAETKGQR